MTCGGARAPGLHEVKALIVDDNATNREILEHTCEAWGMRYATAVDGPSALAQLAATLARWLPHADAALPSARSVA